MNHTTQLCGSYSTQLYTTLHNGFAVYLCKWLFPRPHPTLTRWWPFFFFCSMWLTRRLGSLRPLTPAQSSHLGWPLSRISSHFIQHVMEDLPKVGVDVECVHIECWPGMIEITYKPQRHSGFGLQTTHTPTRPQSKRSHIVTTWLLPSWPSHIPRFREVLVTFVTPFGTLKGRFHFSSMRRVRRVCPSLDTPGGGHSTFIVDGEVPLGVENLTLSQCARCTQIHPVTIYLTENFHMHTLSQYCTDASLVPRSRACHKHCGLGTPGKQPCDKRSSPPVAD